MCSGKLLQGNKRVGHDEEPPFGTGVAELFVAFRNDKGTDTRIVKLGDIAMSIALGCPDGKK